MEKSRVEEGEEGVTDDEDPNTGHDFVDLMTMWYIYIYIYDVSPDVPIL